MVRGIIAFRQHFYNFKDNYILIGGAACDIHEEVEAQVPRATKDLDVILVVEALSPDFVKEFWNFIRHGNYKSRQRGKNKHEYFRFMNPDDDNYPKQVELFARNIGLLNFPEDAHIEPIPVDDEMSSLSAILMNDSYYNFTLLHSDIIDDVHLADPVALICLKAKAFIDLKKRKENGEPIDGRNIEKHKKDVFRLAAMLSGESVTDLPDELYNDIVDFQKMVTNELPNDDFLKSAGIYGLTTSQLLDVIKKVFIKAK